MADVKITAEPGQATLTIVTKIKADIDKLWKAHTDSELIPQWWGPAEYTTTVDVNDYKSGGRWRYVQKGADGEHGFNGVYHYVEPKKLVVSTFEWEGMPDRGHVLLDRTTYKVEGEYVIMTTVNTYLSVEDRDGMIATGMEGGMREGIERLEKLLSAL